MTTNIIDELFATLHRSGSQSYGEDVTQMEHLLQCGALARGDGASDALVAAALLHDVGHFCDDAGDAADHKGVDARHEAMGAAYLASYFPVEVTEPVRLHVEAKRYLCAAEPGYLESLSSASALSLRLQGGPHDPREMAEFLALSAAQDAIRLRRYDDEGKRDDRDVPELESYRPLLQALLRP